MSTHSNATPDVDRPICNALSKIHTPRHTPVSQNFLRACIGAFFRLQICMAIDPVHDRFAVSPDFQYQLPVHTEPGHVVSSWAHLPSSCAMSCIQSFPSPAHFDIGVSHCILLCGTPICFHRVGLAGSVATPHALLFRHHVVALHPRLDRSALMIGSSPLWIVQFIVFQIFSAIFSTGDGRPILLHVMRSNLAVLILLFTQLSQGNTRARKVRRWMRVPCAVWHHSTVN